MSTFLDRALGGSNEWEEARKACEHIQDKFPMLYAILTGIEPKGDLAGIKPGGVRIYTQGGVLKAMCSGEGWENLAYLDCGKELTTLDQIETALKMGNLTWSKRSDRRNSSSGIPF